MDKQNAMGDQLDQLGSDVDSLGTNVGEVGCPSAAVHEAVADHDFGIANNQTACQLCHFLQPGMHIGIAADRIMLS